MNDFLHSEGVLRRFCELVGLEYQDSMVNWPPIGADHAAQFNRIGDAFRLAKETSGFLKTTPTVKVTRDGFEKVIQDTVEQEMPVYQFFKDVAIRCE